MQEKKNKRLLILFCALCCMTIAAFVLSRETGTVDIDKDIFRRYDTREIDQVTMESRQGLIDLKYNGARWQMNNQFDADPSMIQVLFATLEQAEPKRLLAAAMQDSITTMLRQQGVKVTLKSRGEQEALFFVGGNTQKTQAYFADENGLAYLVTIPGYRVYASGIFELREKDWKNKYVFSFNWRNFKKLETRFAEKAADNFSVSLADNYFTVDELSSADTSKLNDYLDKVSLLKVEEYVDEAAVSVTANSPVLSILVSDIADRVYTLELYPAGDTSTRVPGLINGAQWAFFDRAKVSELYRPKHFFAAEKDR